MGNAVPGLDAEADRWLASARNSAGSKKMDIALVTILPALPLSKIIVCYGRDSFCRGVLVAQDHVVHRE